MTKEYYQKNREKIRAQQKVYREQNREKVRAQQKAYYVKNREKVRAQTKAYRVAHPLRNVWTGMMVRCGHHKGASTRTLANYAGRGITVCEEWRHFKPFEEWALANGYRKGLQLDRIDNNGNYCPENCRFVTRSQNSRNRRDTILAAGIPLKTWYDAYKAKMDELGLTYHQVQQRFSKLGWSLEESLFTPLKRRSA